MFHSFISKVLLEYTFDWFDSKTYTYPDPSVKGFHFPTNLIFSSCAFSFSSYPCTIPIKNMRIYLPWCTNDVQYPLLYGAKEKSLKCHLDVNYST